MDDIRNPIASVGPLLTIEQAASLVGLAPTTLRDKVTRGEVPHLRLHRVKGVRFTEQHLVAMLDACQVGVGDRFQRGRTQASSLDNVQVRADPLEQSSDMPDSPADLSRFAGLVSLRAG